MRRPALFVFALCLAIHTAQADPIPLRASPIELLPGHPETTKIGRLEFLGGLHLSSSDARFGGVSGLETAPDGSLIGIADVGYWFRFRPVRDAQGRLVDALDGDLEPLRDELGQAFDGKAWTDAESVRRDAQGQLLVSFERHHRVLRYKAVGGPGMTVDTPPALQGQPSNGGIEALATFPDGRLLLISERARDTDGDLRAWLRDTEGAWHSLAYLTEGERLPTDAAVLPSGDLIVLERKYGLFTELGTRLALIPAARIAPGGKLYGETLASWEAPMSVDNMEGLAIARDADGATLLWVISDDNQSKRQRTLLMLFRLQRPT